MPTLSIKQTVVAHLDTVLDSNFWLMASSELVAHYEVTNAYRRHWGMGMSMPWWVLRSGPLETCVIILWWKQGVDKHSARPKESKAAFFLSPITEDSREYTLSDIRYPQHISMEIEISIKAWDWSLAFSAQTGKSFAGKNQAREWESEREREKKGLQSVSSESWIL